MPTVILGNPQAKHHVTGADLGEQVTVSHIPDDYTRDEQVRTIVHKDGAWAAHSAAETPSWVASDDADLAAALAAVWGGVEVLSMDEAGAELTAAHEGVAPADDDAPPVVSGASAEAASHDAPPAV